MKTGLVIWSMLALACGTTIAANEDVVPNEKRIAEQSSERSILLDVDQLRRKLGDKNLRVLDVRSQADYAKGHIPNAVRVDVTKWKNLAAGDNGFRDADAWSKQLLPFGITKESDVAVYGSKLSDTARIWWLLKYIGVKNVTILDGGWERWVQKKQPTLTAVPTIAKGKFKPDFQTDRLAEIESVKQSLKDSTFRVVDTRSTEEFEDGRIPTSVHLEWKDLIADDGRFKTKVQLQRLFQKRGIATAETAVCY